MRLLQALLILIASLVLFGCQAAPPAAVANATPVSTDIPSPTAAQAATDPAMATRTAVPSSTPTLIPTATPTETAVPSATPTASPSQTLQPSATPTASLTPTASATPTLTPPTSDRPYIIGIDPGHGGRDLGARHFGPDGHMDAYESEIVLDVALRLADRLKARGYTVAMTRDDDYFLNDLDRKDINGDGEVDERDQLQLRVDILNAAKADVFLSIHLNGYEGEDVQDVRGTETLYCDAREFSDKSLLFARLVQKNVVAALASVGYETRDRGVVLDRGANAPGEHMILFGPPDYECARSSQMPGVLNESLFMSNDKEVALLMRDDVRDALADAYVVAIEAYLAEVAAVEPRN